MIVWGLDPGYRQSALVAYNGVSVCGQEILDNAVVLTRLEEGKDTLPKDTVLVVEQISMGGMIAGAEIFETCFWSGRFVEMWSPRRWARVKRKDVKMHLCGQVRATDANIRRALLDRFGPGEELALGTKAKPGPLRGVVSHGWAALAVAITWSDLHGREDLVRPGVAADF